jgi:hypothetical protein
VRVVPWSLLAVLVLGVLWFAVLPGVERQYGFSVAGFRTPPDRVHFAGRDYIDGTRVCGKEDQYPGLRPAGSWPVLLGRDKTVLTYRGGAGNWTELYIRTSDDCGVVYVLSGGP